LEPDDGEVLIDGEPVQRYGLGSYRRRFAYVPQDIQLFGASVRDNILYGRPDASDRDIEDAARVALLHELVLQLPDGYDTALGEGGATLSGGEARRVMLARAALRDARILLLDEPLAGLDPEARLVVASAIRRMARGRTAIVVSHGPAFEVDADVNLRLEQGRVISIDRASAKRNLIRDGLEVGA
jgi:ABC-type multidrug transport system fused ATPase/permease subunit